MSTRARITPGDGDPRHGTENGYTNLCCRCQPCRDAHAKKCAAYFSRLRSKPLPDSVKHGSYNAYRNYGCRCADCKAANARFAAGERATDRRWSA